MEHFRLKVFEAVWNTGSHTKAARQLGITQPAVSQNIAELEKELGTALFTRSAGTSPTDGSSEGGPARGGKMVPTPAAEVFIQLVRKILKDYTDITVLFNPDANEYGKVRIRADRSAAEHALPRVMETLRATHPAVDFDILAPDNTDEEADVVITTIPIGRDGAIVLHFEVLGSATPFVEAVRLLLGRPLFDPKPDRTE